MIKIPLFIKRNWLTVYLYDKYLGAQCRSVNSYIFVANPGRSGSGSLSKIFEAADNAICLHEPYPIMFNDYDEGEDKDEYFRKQFYLLKRIYIKRNARKHKYYLETNHQFIKNFAPYAIEYFGKKIKIIHLLRDPVSVAASFYLIDSSPGTTSRGKYYLIDPRSESNLINISDLLYETEEFSHDLYKCLWYWYEVEARTKLIVNSYPQVQYYKIHTEDLNNITILIDMFNSLNITFSMDKLEKLVGVKENTRTEEKRIKLDMEEVKAMNQRLVDEMEGRYGERFWII